MEYENKVLDHYQLKTPYPTSWPAEKDESNSSEEEPSNTKLSQQKLRRSKSRYSALEQHGTTRRSLVPGSEKTGDGVENLVQRDEADPLGGPDSVVRVLRRHGAPVEDDQRFREVMRDFCVTHVDVL
jgi:exocyst complex component 2